MRSSAEASLSTKPAAPASRASHSTSSSSNVVSTSTGGGLAAVGDAAGGRDAVHPAHADVHQHEVGLVRGDGGGDLVAVAALGDDLEAVVGAEDAGDAGAHDGLVVDDDDADHDATSSSRGAAAIGQAGLDPPAVGGGPGVEAGRRAPGPARPCRPGRSAAASGSGGGAGAAAVGDDQADDRRRSTSTRQLDAVAGGVAGDVGQRLPGDPVHRRADRAGEIGGRRRRSTSSMTSPARRYSSTRAGEVGDAGERRIGAPLVGPQRGDRGADLVEAGPADGLGVDERPLGLVDVARRSTWRAPVTWSSMAASVCPARSCSSRAMRRRSSATAWSASARRARSSWSINRRWRTGCARGRT